MKPKLNLNVAGIKRLAVQHGEKAAFGVAVCILLLFFYKTVRMDVLGADKQPDRLKSLAEQTQQHVVTSEYPKDRQLEVIDYPTRAEHVALDTDHYRLSAYLDKPLWDQHDKRSMPKVFGVEDLQVAAGHGVFAIKRGPNDPPAVDEGAERRTLGGRGDSKAHTAKLSKDVAPKGYFYVTVTGLVPLRKQTAEYEDRFRSADHYSPARDVPVYEHENMKIERAEVSGAAATKLVWKPVDMTKVDEFVGQWPSDAIDDVADAQYTDDAFTMPLGPMIGTAWDPKIAGHAKIPLAERLDDTKKTEKKEEAAPATRRGWVPRDKSGKGAPAATKAPPPAATAAGTKGATAPKAEQKLFRFVDYNVEPGKRYRYRVKLSLHNPNYKIADQFLKDPGEARIPTVETEWSEPSPVITVPHGFQVLAGPMFPRSNNSPRDPEVDMVVVGFDRERGGEPAVLKQVQRGTVLNFLAKEVWVPLADYSDAVMWDKVDFRSNVMVVDVLGGRKLSNNDKQLIEPIEVLLLDADGHAVVRDELADADEYHSRIDVGSSKPKGKAAEPMVESENPYGDPKSKGGSRGRTPTKAKTPATRTSSRR